MNKILKRILILIGLIVAIYGANRATLGTQAAPNISLVPGLAITSLLNCDTLNTSATGTVICGTDDGGSGTFTTTTINGMSSTTYTFVAGAGLTFATSGPSNLTYTNNGVLSINGATGTLSGLNIYNTTTTVFGLTGNITV